MLDYKKEFPYDTIRPEQDRVLKQICENWDSKKYFILQLDVGVGKSGIAKTMANLSSNAFIVTETKQLLHQYEEDFRNQSNMVTIKGKSNYVCNKVPKVNCDQGPCNLTHKYTCSDNCKYFLQRNRAIQAQIALTSYAYIFRAFEASQVWHPRELMVFDECHLLEQQLVVFAQFYLDPKELDNKFSLFNNLSNEDYVKAIQPFTQKGWEANKDRFNVYFNCVTQKKEELEHTIEDIQKTDPSGTSEVLHKSFKELDEISGLYEKMLCFRGTFSGDMNEWLISPTIDNALEFTPISVKSLFKYSCDNWADKFLMMSATILDIDGFIDELGIDKSQVCVIKEESTFDPAKSPIYYMPCGSMNYQNIEESMPMVIDVTKKVLNSKPFDKGIIHTGNYKIAKQLYESIGSSRFLMKQNDRETNEWLLRRHEEPGPSVLLSPSMTTGVDLKDDLSRWQIVVKMPFGSLADERIKMKSAINYDWYACEALKTLVQACGRSTRSVDDHSVTYVLDSSFKYWVMKYKDWLPKNFLARIKGF